MWCMPIWTNFGSLAGLLPKSACLGVGIFHVNRRFHYTAVGWNLGWTRKRPTLCICYVFFSGTATEGGPWQLRKWTFMWSAVMNATVSWVIDWLTDWLIYRLINWLINRLISRIIAGTQFHSELLHIRDTTMIFILRDNIWHTFVMLTVD